MQLSEEQFKKIENVFGIIFIKEFEEPYFVRFVDEDNWRISIINAIPKKFYEFWQTASGRKLVGDFKYLPAYEFNVENKHGEINLGWCAVAALGWSVGYEDSIDEYISEWFNMGKKDKDLALIIKRYFDYDIKTYFSNPEKLEQLRTILKECE